jgi:hypothetical protein
MLKVILSALDMLLPDNLHQSKRCSCGKPLEHFICFCKHTFHINNCVNLNHCLLSYEPLIHILGIIGANL